MTVRRADNSRMAAPVQQRMTDITDGTSNTMASAEKAEKPFSKDEFESPQPKTNSLCTNEVINPLVKCDDDSKLKIEGAKGQVVENLNVKYTLFLPD